ncbi:MAG: protein translocase subunit SecF [Calditrichaeota bacterium]|nr:MAG: protein translocase subunit SecF [Calditrichota bacterium]
MEFFTNTNYDIVGKRKIGYILSGSLILISIISLILHGGPKYNIDFTGGSLLQLKFEKDVAIQDIRKALATENMKDAEIKHFGAKNEVAIRTGVEVDIETVGHTIENAIKKALLDNPFSVERVEKVGPKVGHELIIDALLAILWSMVLILFYIMWRFEFKFSIGAIVALAHDVTITMGIFSVFNIEISAPIIAAILTIVGYSLNDTIVVYDRIRENLKSTSKRAADISGIVNRSINETLSRTIMTSGTTLIVVVVLYFFGGEVLRTFAEALIIGIVVGTYSSIFIASPIVIDWKHKKA